MRSNANGIEVGVHAARTNGPPKSSDSAAFFREFIRDPLSIGAIAPSSPQLAMEISASIPETGHPIVLEVGPGTGAFTDAIQRRLGGRGLHVAIEANEKFATRLRCRFRGVDVVAGGAVHALEILASRGVRSVDVVVSGLPWAAFRPELQRSLLSVLTRSLSPSGALTTFAYIHARWMPSAASFLRLLKDHMEEVVMGRTVWRNLPPAMVYHSRRPRRGGTTDRRRASPMTLKEVGPSTVFGSTNS